MHDYLCGLYQAKSHTALSPQAKRDLAQLVSLDEFKRQFANTPHKAQGVGLERLASKERYAYEFISLAQGFQLSSIMGGIVQSGSKVSGFRTFVDKFTNLSLEKKEFVAVYCSVTEIAKRVGQPGRWIMKPGYEFSGSMLILARQERLLPATKHFIRDMLKRIYLEGWARGPLVIPWMDQRPYVVSWLN